MSIHSSIIGNCDKLICKFSLTESAFCNAFSSAFAMHGQCIVKCMRCWLVALLLVGGCVESSLVVCGDKLCPVGAFCTPDGCVLQDQIDVCRDKAEGDPCQVLDLPAGFCRNGTCVSAVCGNTLMEPNEACDDGNHEAGDGCSADCRSLEKCGNNIIDLINNEQCDVGVPFLSGDGCTSSCQAEFDIWRDVTPTQLSARWGAKMVRDPVHDEIVMFGGFNSAALGDTWVLRAGAWEKRTPASSPEPRYGHAMAYLPNVGVVMFGGTNGQGIYFNGTWVWNGSSWTKLNIDPSTAPSDRSGAAMALNPQNDHLMLFGGSHGATVYGDTWEFDGSSWSKVSTPTVSGMPFVTMFVDPNAGVPDSGAVWILGGDGSSTGGKLLFWEISQWVTHLPPGGIPPYVEPGISVDHSRVVLFGGRDQNTGLPTSTTYFWDSDNWQWTSQIVTGAPTGRSRVAAANDGTNLVVYGGVSSVNTPLSGTHQLTTVTIPTTSYRYTTIPTTPLPSARFGAMSTYDGRTGEIFIFGGYTPINSEDADLWRWTFPLWRTGSVEPPGRMHGAMVYDEAREETVLFGGADDCATGSGGGSGGGPCDGAGSGSGSGGTGSVLWGVVSVRRSARADAAIGYDPINEIVLLFGGQNDTGLLADTWQWNGTAWMKLLPANSPPTMEGGRMVYDRAHSLFVLYGGVGALGTVWTFDGTTWREVTPPSSEVQPPGRRRSVFIYNPRRHRSLLFGGILPNGQILNDTWARDGTSVIRCRRRRLATMPPLHTTPRAESSSSSAAQVS
jgi:cysteine-rich repeat protein